jgi:hypothetical protein
MANLLKEINITETYLSQDQLKKGKQLMLQFSDIFTKDHDVGQTNRVKHPIDLLDETPFKHRYKKIQRPCMIK